MTDYHTNVANVYAGAIGALHEVGLTSAQLIDTGGSCKAIHVDLDEAASGIGPHLLLTSYGPLTDERCADEAWEVGVYDGDDGMHVYFFRLDARDCSHDDKLMAQEVRVIYDGLRDWHTGVCKRLLEERRRQREQEERLANLRLALQQFKQAAAHLSNAWAEITNSPGDEIANYPDGWLSFDEEVCRIMDMEVK